jgi:ribose transport system substrate-binding protein
MRCCSRSDRLVGSVALFLVLVLAMIGCRHPLPVIAVIPRTTGTPLWESEHAGAAEIARSNGLSIYWNAPTEEDDIQAQIALVETAQARGYAGIIVAPIETLPLRAPIRNILEHGIPVVVVGTDLGIPSGTKLAYVLNDEEVGGELAARRIGSVLHGKGSIAIVGIDPTLTSNMKRERSFESRLAQEFPQINVVARQFGLPRVPQEQQAVERLLHSGESIDAIVALSLASTRGAYYAVAEFGKENTVKLVGFDQDLLPPIRTGGIDSVVAQNTYEMGEAAMEIMNQEFHGAAHISRQIVPPVLITRENIDSPEIRQLLNITWWSTQ